ncbi:protein UXT-like [Gouania willdenowi]|uniref:Protein UXT n=1 Tax=Gouania willdenowi TaxID=441366 RepID=A0A8C5N7K4_GOUWI|nr:protein UXT-like [Gouania willdenowi]XP_028308014.1 protein UXT-like [Gouania willdenowi]
MLAPADSTVTGKVLQYENFVNDVLRRDLRAVMDQRDQVYEKISEYLQLKNTIQSLQEAESGHLKTEVDLGCNFFVQAQIEDASRIFVAVGFGFFVEFTLDEALKFIDKKTNQLTAFTEQLTKDSAKIKAHIRLVLEGLRELQGLSELTQTQTSRGDVF